MTDEVDPFEPDGEDQDVPVDDLDEQAPDEAAPETIALPTGLPPLTPPSPELLSNADDQSTNDEPPTVKLPQIEAPDADPAADPGAVLPPPLFPPPPPPASLAPPSSEPPPPPDSLVPPAPVFPDAPPTITTTPPPPPSPSAGQGGIAPPSPPGRAPAAGRPAPSSPAAPTPQTAKTPGRGRWIAVGAIGALGVVGAAFGLGAAFGGSTNDGPSNAAVTTVDEANGSEPELATPVPTQAIEESAAAPDSDDADSGPIAMSIADLARATVQILPATDRGEPVCVGSGSIISTGGRILTNAHVIDPTAPCQHSQILIAVTTNTDQLPEVTYRADVLSVDVGLDLAVLQIAERIDGGAVPTQFSHFDIGDSNEIQLGDPIRIFGYPAIGGDTITFTNGSVSGFTQARDIEGRAWIKTDATIAGGNSGGAAVDTLGRLIGIPTQVSAGEDADVVDCRVLTDTNGDNRVDDNDQCIPIGGFINGVRPVALAADVISSADSATPTRVFDGPMGAVTTGNEVFRFPIFSSDIDADDTPTDDIRVGRTSQRRLCFSFDHRGLVDGTRWSALWFVNDDLDESLSLVDVTWNNGSDGTFWVCADSGRTLAAGTYELLFQLESDTVWGESITVLPEGAPTAELMFTNRTGGDICFLRYSPAWASFFGLDELRDEILDDGDTFRDEVTEGQLDIRWSGCDGEAGEFSVNVPESGTFAIDIDR